MRVGGWGKDTKTSLFLGLVGMCYPISWRPGSSSALKKIKPSREAEKMWVKVMLASLFLSSNPSLILLIVPTQPEFRGLGSLVRDSALER